MDFPKFKIVLKPFYKAPKKTLVGKVKALCVKEDGEFKARISASLLKGDVKDDLVIPFTKESYDLHRALVFSIKPDAQGRYEKFLRHETTYKYHPGLPTQYCALCENYIFSGNIVTINGKKFFDMKEVIKKNINGV